MTFAELIAAYQTHLQSLRRHPSTLSNHRAVTTDFARFCQASLGLSSPRELQSSHILAYLQRLSQLPLTPLVRYSRQRLVRSWLAWATYRGYLLVDPSKGFEAKHPPLLPRGSPTEGQVQQLLQAPDDSLPGRRDRALLELLYGTGLRIGECVALDVGDVDLAQRQLVVRRGKNGSSRVVPLGQRLCACLAAYLAQVRPQFPGAESTALWLSGRGARLTVVLANGRLRKWCSVADVKLTAHSLRHAFATHLLARGAPLVAIQRLLGHTTMGMTTRYTHLVPVDVQAAVKGHHPRGSKKTRRRPRTSGG